MTEVTKSKQVCRRCKTSEHVIRLQWQDDVGGPTIDYDDHVCLECGLYANGNGCSLQAKSLKSYQDQYGYVVAPIKRFLDLIWASLPREWDIEVRQKPDISQRFLCIDVEFVHVNRKNVIDRSFYHRFDTVGIARHKDDLDKWTRQRVKAIMRAKGG